MDIITVTKANCAARMTYFESTLLTLLVFKAVVLVVIILSWLARKCVLRWSRICCQDPTLAGNCLFLVSHAGNDVCTLSSVCLLCVLIAAKVKVWIARWKRRRHGPSRGREEPRSGVAANKSLGSLSSSAGSGGELPRHR